MTTGDEGGDAAYQGQPGAYSEEAAWALAGRDAVLLPCPSLAVLFDAVVRGRARHGVLPVENSLAGTVPRAYELLLEHDVRACGETRVRIDHVLVAPPGVPLAAIRRVLSHPVALDQCVRFIADRRLEPEAAFDTAGAVAQVMAAASGDTAAIASRRAAARYGAAILAEHIQDHPENWTRFLLLAPAGRTPLRGRKAILSFRLRHDCGTLSRALAVIAAGGVNLTKIESRPIHGRPFEYAFVLEVVSADADPDWLGWLADLRPVASDVQLLGAWGLDAGRVGPGPCVTSRNIGVAETAGSRVRVRFLRPRRRCAMFRDVTKGPGPSTPLPD